MPWIVFLAAAILIVVLVEAYRRRLSVRERTRLDTRETLTDDQIYGEYYGDSGIPKEVVAELWHEIAETLSVNPGKMRPGDRFGQDVGSAEFITSEDLDLLVGKALSRAKRKGIDVQQKDKIATVDDYVKVLGCPPTS